MDGSEIHEAVCLMLAIEQQGGSCHCFAPEGEQGLTINHLTKQPSEDSRRTLVESARIARGNISSLKSFKASDYDAIAFPGGAGAVLTLCNFAQKGPECDVNPDVERAITEMNQAGKPIAALCIAPVVIARVLKGITVTIGNDPETNLALKSMGATTQDCSAAEVCIDKKNKIITTPAYMLDKSLRDVASSASNAVKDLMAILDGR